MITIPGHPHSPVAVAISGNSYLLTVSGHGFGDRMGSVIVTDVTVPAAVVPVILHSWSDHKVVVEVPNIALGGTPGIGPVPGISDGDTCEIVVVPAPGFSFTFDVKPVALPLPPPPTPVPSPPTPAV